LSAPLAQFKEDKMSTTQSHRQGLSFPDPNFVQPEGNAPGTRAGNVARYVSAALRLSLGWVFLWAFLDKAFGFGHETAKADAWIHGGSPTSGFLTFAAAGPFKGIYNNIGGQAWADVLFMVSLLAIGAALMLGVAMRVAAASGALLVFLMWTAVLPPANNLFMDDHLVYAMVLVLLAAVGAGRTLGFGQIWERIPVVRRNGWLK
jgi:thiosulfate dehydrogenase (quinone) large subunit